MRKYIFLLIALCLQIAARGQTIVTLDDFDLSWVPQPTQAKALRYWFDDDAATVQTTSLLAGSHTIDVAALMDGLHTLHYQVIDSKDAVAYASSGVFLKMNTLATTAPTGLRSLRYWFDNDGAAGVKTLPSATGVHTLDVSSLMDGLHTLHCQVVDTDGNVAYASSGVFLKMNNISTAAAVTASKLLYWFDNETAFQTVDMTGGVQMLDVSQLMDGLHTLHYQVVCSDNQLTASVSSVFLKMNMAADAATTAQNLRYWFDEEQTATTVEIADGVQMLDASRLMDGLHTIHYQIVDSKNQVGAPASAVFLKMNMAADAATTAQTLRYWYDTEQTATTVEITEGVQMLDAARLMDGLHTIHYQIVDSKNQVGAPASAVFLKMNMAAATTTAQSLRYWFDNDASTVKTIDVSGGTQTLDVSDLLPGLHTLNYQLTDSEGRLTAPVTRIFVKNFERLLPEGENRITAYQYWLNTNSQAMQTVELNAAANPYTLITLLPLQKEPIHSDCFHFEMTNDVPTIYAKNILHVRFHDAQGYFSDGEKPFVDYSVKQEVEPVDELQATQTFPKVTENDIRWYTMQVAPGDTAAFRLSQAATLQVFAPSGKEVFKTSESASVQWGGIHTWEDGTYYVAVHDVTGSRSNMTLDYMHMDKYDIVDWDVHTVGNGGCSTITFRGNGFRDLYAVDLYTAAGDSIHSVDISHDSDAETSVTFDFSGAELGIYDAVFHFTQEDKRFTNIVTVEEAVDIELATNVSFPSTFLRGTSTTYTIKITNNGNMTAYAVPLELKLICNSVNDISKIKMSGYISSINNTNELLNDSIDEDVINLIYQIEDNESDLLHFSFNHDSISNNDYGLSLLLLNLPPYSTKHITVEITSSTQVGMFAYMTSEWIPLIIGNGANKTKSVRRANVADWLCCYKDRIECIADAIAMLSDKIPGVPPNWNCGIQVLNTTAQAIYDIGCSEGGNLSERIKSYAQQKGESLAKKLIDTAISCVTKYFKFRKDELREQVKAARAAGKEFTVRMLMGEIDNIRQYERNAIIWIYSNVRNAVGGIKCVNIWRQPIPNCPPNPNGGGGSSTPVNSCEPNDVLGYTAESGSKAIKDGLTDIYYTIQFENDTVFADAPAHDIYLTDTLDVNLFDLSTYRPTKITIGNKSMDLTGKRNFISTLDMRPEINAIAQIEGSIDDKTGIVHWHISSLHPMTMEPSDDPMVGVLPVNFNGSGLGEASYDISLKKDLPHGTVIPNRSGNIFDSNETVMTPTWTNLIDRIAPESHVADVKMLNDSTATVSIEATDELSGPWRYNVYVQYGSGAWFLGAENVPIDTTASVKVYEGINHGFYVVVTDSAGNVEQKNAEREFTLEVFGSQVDTDTQLMLAEGWNWVSHNQQDVLAVEDLKPSALRMVGQTEETIKDTRFGWMGDLEELLPTQMYKLQMSEAANVQLSGRLFNAGFRSIPLYEGWNWIGYPVANVMTPAEALTKLEAEEGDFIIGQDGMATFSDGEWTGTLTEMQPGLGYMYRSASNKNLFYNATAQASARQMAKRRAAEVWTVEKRKYPNVMAVVANLCQNGVTADADEWLLAAFCGDECRGVASTVNGVLMMNVYGTGSEPISFYAMNRETEEVMQATETEEFRTDVLGSMQHPYELHIGEVTGIVEIDNGKLTIDNSVYDLQGRRIGEKLSAINAQLKKGIYIVTDGKNTKTQKVVRK